MNEKPKLLDLATYESLQEALGADNLTLVMHSFRSDAQTLVKQIGAALARADTEEVGKLCHQLKATSQAIGALQFAEKVIELEQYRFHHDLNKARQLYMVVLQLFNQLLQDIEPVAASGVLP